MDKQQLLDKVQQKANHWLQSDIDQKSKNQIRELFNNEEELIDSFYKDLEFGTGGLRGIMGVGSNRVNDYTIGMATQGLANYLNQTFSDQEEISVAIAHDSRNNSKSFARRAANVLASNNIKVYLFDDLRPTPELSFAIRHLNCKSGIVITASHNPKEYNGYKVYWEDGGQIIAPHDKNIINEVQKINDVSFIQSGKNEHLIQNIGNEIDEIYLKKLSSLSLSPDVIKRQSDLKIVYTPIHGTGVYLVPQALRKIGFENILSVKEQDIPDGNFPTVQSPNPEEASALEMAINIAKSENADLVMATDPDADRVGIAIKEDGEFVLLNGNQTATILIYYLLHKWKENNKLKGKEYIIKTIVTTELLKEIADDFDVPCYDVLTGFKYIADIIKKLEGEKIFIGGGEESYGYLAGEFVRDKDAVMSCALIAEIAAWAKDQNKTLNDILNDIYIKYGLYKEELISLVKKGRKGNEEIKQMMDNFRNAPPSSLSDSRVMLIHDYQKQKSFDMISDLRYDIALPASNVLQFICADGSKISIRPSGTEPKIKFYISVNEIVEDFNDLMSKHKILENKIQNITKELGIE